MTCRSLRPVAAVIRRFPRLFLPLRRAFERLFSPPQGAEGIRKVGHRRYVGGRWDALGREQLEFLKSRGLEPRHVLLDIACGSLRLGRHAIPFLEPGHYLGIEKEQELLDAGVRHEIDLAVLESRRPELLTSADFEFDRLSRSPDFAIANSLFTHLPPPLIRLCLARLRPFIRPDGVFYATFFEAERAARNPEQPHDHHMFVYTRDEMRSFGAANGWEFEYIGDWGHARGQVMVAYHPAP